MREYQQSSIWGHYNEKPKMVRAPWPRRKRIIFLISIVIKKYRALPPKTIPEKVLQRITNEQSTLKTITIISKQGHLLVQHLVRGDSFAGTAVHNTFPIGLHRKDWPVKIQTSPNFQVDACLVFAALKDRNGGPVKARR